MVPTWGTSAWATASYDCSAFGMAGSGAEGDPFQIESATEFANMPDCADSWSAVVTHYLLKNDISLTGYSDPLGAFSGVLDGGGFAVSDISISSTVSEHVGLFSILNGPTTIKNLELLGQVTGLFDGLSNGTVGLLAGSSQDDVTLENLNVRGDVVNSAVSAVGLLIGAVAYDLDAVGIDIQDSTVHNDAAQNLETGGLFGSVGGMLTANRITLSGLVVSAEDAISVGGLVGSAFGLFSPASQIENLIVENVTVSGGGGSVGGLVGSADAALSFSDISVHGLTLSSGGDFFGGLVGEGDEAISIQTAELIDVDISVANGSLGASRGGGLVGNALGGLQADDISIGNVEIQVSNSSYVSLGAGLVDGSIEITNSYLEDSQITGSAIGNFVGGWAGYVTSNVSISEVIVDNVVVRGSNYVGGYFGYVAEDVDGFDLTQMRVVVSASGDAVGGFIGYSLGDADLSVVGGLFNSISGQVGVGFSIGTAVGLVTIADHFAMSSWVSGTGKVGGLIGDSSGDVFAYSIQSEDMQIEDIDPEFSGFDGYFGGLIGMAGGLSHLGLVTISNLVVSSSAVGYVGGLIGSGQGLSLGSLSVIDLQVYGAFHVGGLAGNVTGATFGDIAISNGLVYSDRVVSNETYVGGLIGFNYGDISIENISVSGLAVSGSWAVGGFVGENQGDATFTDLRLQNLNVLASQEAVGGLIGVLGSDLSVSGIAISNLSITANESGGSALVQDVNGDAYVHDMQVTSFSAQTDGGTSAGIGQLDGTGSFSDISMATIFLETGDSVPGSGGLVGKAESQLSFEDIALFDVFIQGAEYVGGLFGSQADTYLALVSDIRVVSSSFVVDGNSGYVGGLAGMAFDVVTDNISITDVNVSAVNPFAGGGFGQIRGTGSFSGIFLSSITVSSGGGSSGGFIGSIDALNLTGLDASAVTVTGASDSVGGIIGSIDEALSASNLILNGISVSGEADNLGGFAGYSKHSTVSGLVLTDMTLNQVGNNSEYLGGVIGLSFGTLLLDEAIVSSFSMESQAGPTGVVSGMQGDSATIAMIEVRNGSLTGDFLGGVFGLAAGNINASFLAIFNLDLSTIAGTVGLFLGTDAGGQQIDLSDSYLEGDIETPGGVAEKVGLVIGNLDGSSVLTTNELIVSNYIAYEDVAVINGFTSTASYATEIAPSEFAIITSFPGWDFQNIWGFDCNDQSFPRLRQLFNGLQTDCSAEQEEELSIPVLNSPGVSADQPQEGSGVTSRTPIISSLSSQILTPGQTLRVLGQNLDLVTAILLNGAALEVISIGATEVFVAVPQNATSGSGTLTFRYSSGSFSSAVTVSSYVDVPSKKVTITSFQGGVYVYLVGFKGKALSMKLAGKWIVIPSLEKNFIRVGRRAAVNRKINVSVFIDRKLTEVKTIQTR